MLKFCQGTFLNMILEKTWWRVEENEPHSDTSCHGTSDFICMPHLYFILQLKRKEMITPQKTCQPWITQTGRKHKRNCPKTKRNRVKRGGSTLSYNWPFLQKKTPLTHPRFFKWNFICKTVRKFSIFWG